jgi:hypothetical protein
MSDKRKPKDIPVRIDGGLLVVVAEILRAERGLEQRDFIAAQEAISAALRRMNAHHMS